MYSFALALLAVSAAATEFSGYGAHSGRTPHSSRGRYSRSHSSPSYGGSRFDAHNSHETGYGLLSAPVSHHGSHAPPAPFSNGIEHDVHAPVHVGRGAPDHAPYGQNVGAIPTYPINAHDRPSSAPIGAPKEWDVSAQYKPATTYNPYYDAKPEPVATPTPAQYLAKSAPGYHGYNSHQVYSRDGYVVPTNVWTEAPAVVPVPATWYSATQQYSPPKISFKSVVTKPTFATCNFNGNDVMKFAQFPGHPALSKVDISGTPFSQIAAVTFTINEFAVLRTSATVCDQVGDEFNNLKETNKYGDNPYQDFSRGRIAGLTGAETASSAPAELLQNLAGEDSIIGRSVVADVSGALQCCVIGLDSPPPRYVADPVYPYDKYHGAKHH